MNANAMEWLNELEKKADVATPGPWKVVTGNNPEDACAVCAETPMFIPFSGRNGKSNASFIASANPETVKRLLLMIEHLAYLACDTDKGNDDKQAEQNIQWAFEESDPRRYA